MKSDLVMKPPNVSKVYEFMVAELEIMNAKRMELIDSIGWVVFAFYYQYSET